MSSPTSKPITPQGWEAVWDEQYQEWYYVHLASGKSQWEAPAGTTFPVAGPPPGGPPPRQQQQQQPVSTRTHTETVIVEKQPIYVQQQHPQVYQQQRTGPGLGTGLVMGALIGSSMGRRRRRRF